MGKLHALRAKAQASERLTRHRADLARRALNGAQWRMRLRNGRHNGRRRAARVHAGDSRTDGVCARRACVVAICGRTALRGPRAYLGPRGPLHYDLRDSTGGAQIRAERARWGVRPAALSAARRRAGGALAGPAALRDRHRSGPHGGRQQGRLRFLQPHALVDDSLRKQCQTSSALQIWPGQDWLLEQHALCQAKKGAGIQEPHGDRHQPRPIIQGYIGTQSFHGEDAAAVRRTGAPGCQRP